MRMSGWTMARPRPNFGENEEIAFFILKLSPESGLFSDLAGNLARGAGFGVKIG